MSNAVPGPEISICDIDTYFSDVGETATNMINNTLVGDEGIIIKI